MIEIVSKVPEQKSNTESAELLREVEVALTGAEGHWAVLKADDKTSANRLRTYFVNRGYTVKLRQQSDGTFKVYISRGEMK